MDKSSPSIPATMRAWIHSRPGKPSDVLELSSQIPTPTIKTPTDVLVRVSYAALNPGGSIMMQLCPFFLRSSPAIPEMDFSGVVVDAGEEALKSDRIAVGDHVFGSIGVGEHIKAGSGALAGYVVVPIANVLRKPSNNATDAEAAGIGTAGCTAMALMERCGLKNGDSVLVNGASGGIGATVVQIARDLVGKNGRVVAICSGGNAEMVRGLGADEVCPSSKPYRTRIDWLTLSHRLLIIMLVDPYLSTSGPSMGTSDLTQSLTRTESRSSTATVIDTSSLGSLSFLWALHIANTPIRACYSRFSA
jgi:NADPH:quinone reductase-like Zn-dependent oxidoreductase